MKYLIAQARSGNDFTPDEIFVIPVTENLANKVNIHSQQVRGQIESILLLNEEAIYGYRIPANYWPKPDSRSLKSFRTFLENELATNEFEFMEENAALNEDILHDIAEKFYLGINVLEASAIFQQRNKDYDIEYTTYSIPLTCLALSPKLEIPCKN